MEDTLYVWIDKKRYRLYKYVNVDWRLFYYIDRKDLQINDAHDLDYWRKKGVIEGEEEKTDG